MFFSDRESCDHGRSYEATKRAHIHKPTQTSGYQPADWGWAEPKKSHGPQPSQSHPDFPNIGEASSTGEEALERQVRLLIGMSSISAFGASLFTSQRCHGAARINGAVPPGCYNLMELWLYKVVIILGGSSFLYWKNTDKSKFQETNTQSRRRTLASVLEKTL